MKLGELYRQIVQFGIANDPRGEEAVGKDLDRTKKDHDKLKNDEKERFDKERLENPYADSRVLHGDADLDVKALMVGIDIDPQEILLADRLREKGKAVDLVLGHHPRGAPMANLHMVMRMQAEILHSVGVPITAAEGVMDGRIKEVERILMSANHMRAVDAARLLDIPFICAHTPADNCVATFLQRLLDEKTPDRVEDVMDVLREVPEYKASEEAGFPMKMFAGSKDKRAGKVLVDMTGGTSGAKESMEKLAATEVGTLVGMHIPEEHRKEAEKHHINVLIAGHMASDTLGMNLLLDHLETEEPLEVISCSGFRRIRRPA